MIAQNDKDLLNINLDEHAFNISHEFCEICFHGFRFDKIELEMKENQQVSKTSEMNNIRHLSNHERDEFCSICLLASESLKV